MPEHADRTMLAREPKRDHKVLRDRMKALTPMEDKERRSHTHTVAIPSSINYSTMDITRFRPHHHSRSSYIVVFNPLLQNHEPQQPSSEAQQTLPELPNAKVLIIHPEFHGHENDHVIRVPIPKIEEMLADFEADSHNPKFRPQRLSSKKPTPEEIRKHKELETTQRGQTLALLRILETALQPTPQNR